MKHHCGHASRETTGPCTGRPPFSPARAWDRAWNLASRTSPPECPRCRSPGHRPPLLRPFNEYLAATTKKLEEALAKARPGLAPASGRGSRDARALRVAARSSRVGRLARPLPGRKEARGEIFSPILTDSPTRRSAPADVGRHFREQHCFQVRALSSCPATGRCPVTCWRCYSRSGSTPRGTASTASRAKSTTSTSLRVLHRRHPGRVSCADSRGGPFGPTLASPGPHPLLASAGIQVADASRAPLVEWHKIL